MREDRVHHGGTGADTCGRTMPGRALLVTSFLVCAAATVISAGASLPIPADRAGTGARSAPDHTLTPTAVPGAVSVTPGDAAMNGGRS